MSSFIELQKMAERRFDFKRDVHLDKDSSGQAFMLRYRDSSLVLHVWEESDGEMYAEATCNDWTSWNSVKTARLERMIGGWKV